MTNCFWRHPCVNYIVSHCPPLHLKTVTHTRARNVANSQYHTADKSNKPSTKESELCLSAGLTVLQINISCERAFTSTGHYLTCTNTILWQQFYDYGVFLIFTPCLIFRKKSVFFSFFRIHQHFYPTALIDGFGGLVVSMLASGSRVRGFEPGQSRWIFQM
jgi:hypothetical protein